MIGQVLGVLRFGALRSQLIEKCAQLVGGHISAVDDGSLHESWRQQPGTPAYCTDLSADELQQSFASLGTQRTPEQHAQFLANQEASEKQLQAQGVKL